MKIPKLELKGHRGFKLRQIEHLIYEPEKKTQIVLGTNGSGKSTLLRELSPLPGNPNDYKKPGFKIITVEHNKRIYVLSSLFETTGNKYVFELDGENLNPGHTLTVYKELVKQHFGYTQEIHDLLTGQTKFHSMSVAERREWFTRISDTDYTYALKYYRRLKERIRDIQGSLSRLKPRLVQETEKCLTDKEIESTKQKNLVLNEMLDRLLRHRKPHSGQTDLEEDLVYLETQLDTILMRLDERVTDNEYFDNRKTLRTLESEQIGLEHHLRYLQKDSDERCEFIESLQKQLDLTQAASLTPIEGIQKAIASIEEEELELRPRISFDASFSDPSSALTSLNSVSNYLTEIIETISGLPKQSYSRDEYQYLKTVILPKQKNELIQLEETVSKLSGKKHALEEEKQKESVACPRCNHSFYPGYNETLYKKICSDHKELLDKKEVLDQRLAEDTAKLRNMETYFDSLSQYNRITSSVHSLEPFWNYIASSELLYKSPSLLINKINSLRIDLGIYVRLDKNKLQLKELQSKLVSIENANKLDQKKIEKDIEERQMSLRVLLEDLNTTKKKLTETKSLITILSDVEQLHESLQQAIECRDKALKSLIEDCCISALDDLIRSMKTEVTKNEYRLSQITLQKEIVKNLDMEIIKSEEELRLLKLTEQALSPTEGLIAKGMTGFINYFVSEVNKFIRTIWLYPLELIPIEHKNENVDLDYRFEVIINDDPNNVSPDVSKTSVGMQEVIDLAFAAVSMKYLGLSDFPIFLDEFAKGLDHAHRQSAYQAIDHLINSKDYSQVYLVSHYQDGYGNLSDAEILVLCDSNVELPSNLVYNKHVTFG